jgi:hypothetical protein
VVQELNQDTVWILEVKRAGAIAMRFWGVGERNSKFLKSRGEFIHVLWGADYKPDVMDALHWPGVLFVGQFVNGEVIGARRQIDIFLVGFPFHVHPQHVAIEFHGSADVANVQCNMSQSERVH